MLQHATQSTFESLALTGTVVVEFSSPWCPPCRALETALHQEIARRPDLRVVQVDVSAEPALGQTYAIRSIPTVIALHDGRPIAMEVGFAGPARLARFLDRVEETAPRPEMLRAEGAAAGR